MIAARRLSAFCLGLALLAAVGAVAPALGSSDGPLFTSPAEVREAQRILQQEKYLRPGASKPGQLDDATMGALRAFQTAHFLPATGRIDLDTMGSLVGHGLRQASGRMAREGSGGTGSEERVALTAATGTAAGRSMPATGSPTVLAAAIGTLLIGAGLALIYLRRPA